MKRHIQNAGLKKWFGDYLCELESEPLAAVDQWASAYGGCILSGGTLTLVSGTTYDVASGLVVLKIDGEYKVAPLPATPNVDVSVQKVIRLKKTAVTGQYQNPSDLTIAYDYSAEIIDYMAGLGTLNEDYLLIPTNGSNIRSYANVVKDALDVVSTASKGLMSAADKIKLNGIEENANKYIHPPTHPPSIIAQDSNNRFVTDAEKANFWSGNGSTYLMSSKAIGIGTAPIAKLDIKQDADIYAKGLRIRNADDVTSNIWMKGNSLMIQQSWNNNQLVLDSSGRVGVGINPTEKFDVNGNIKATGGNIYAAKGRKPTGILHQTSGTLDAIYSALNTIIPNIGDTIVLSGALKLRDEFFSVSYAKRINSTTININCCSNLHGAIVLSVASDSLVTCDCSLAW